MKSKRRSERHNKLEEDIWGDGYRIDMQKFKAFKLYEISATKKLDAVVELYDPSYTKYAPNSERLNRKIGHSHHCEYKKCLQLSLIESDKQQTREQVVIPPCENGKSPICANNSRSAAKVST